MRSLIQRAIAVSVVASAVLTACGGDSDEHGAAFCADMSRAQQRFSELTQTESDDLRPLVDDLGAIEPPDEIRDAYMTVVDTYAAMAEAGAVTGPDLATALADADEAITKVDDYITDRCGQNSDPAD